MLGWTFEVFITADNNLSSIADEQLSQFRGTDPRRVNVVVQVDTPRVTTRRHVLNRDGSFRRLRKRRQDKNLNSGYVQTLIDFMIAAKNLRPAHNIFLVLNGHGSGITEVTRAFHLSQHPGKRRHRKLGAMALVTDDTSHDFLDNHELEHALRSAEYKIKKYPKLKKPAVIGCDACLMASVELAHQLAGRALFFVASQDNEPVEGWPYREILKSFNSRIGPHRAAINVVESYGDATKMDDYATLSAIDLSVMTDLAEDLDRLGAALVQYLPDEMRIIARAREDARTFANFDSVDLRGFVAALVMRFERAAADKPLRQELIAAAQAVLTTLGRAVIATSKEPSITGAYGLSAYIPNSTIIEAYQYLPLARKAPRWYAFVKTYGDLRGEI